MAERSPLRTFLSFSHRDIKLCEKLRAHLSTLVKDEHLIELWWDRDLRAGRWDPEIMNQLDASDIILLLVSAEYIASEYCRKEYFRAMERHQAFEKGREDGAIVVPIWLRDCNYKKAAFGELNSLPAGSRSIDKWPNQDEAFKNVANQLHDIVTKKDGWIRLAEHSSGPRDETTNVLPHLCNRSELVVSLNQMFSDTEFAAGKTREGRPYVLVIYGYQDDCPEGFKSRLEYKLLPKFFKVQGRIVPIPVDWPRVSNEEAAKDEFSWYVASKLDCQPADICTHLPGPVTLFISFFDYEQWRKSGVQPLRGFLKFWDTFPTVEGQQIVSCLIVRIPRDPAAVGPNSGPGWLGKMFGRPGRPQDPTSILDSLEAYTNVNLRTLKLTPIKEIHVDNWVDEPEVRVWCRPQTENEMRHDLRAEFSKTEEMPMGDLVRPMQQALTRYKNTG